VGRLTGDSGYATHMTNSVEGMPRAMRIVFAPHPDAECHSPALISGKRKEGFHSGALLEGDRDIRFLGLLGAAVQPPECKLGTEHCLSD